MAKFINQITINLDDESLKKFNYMAKTYNRKPAELGRILLIISIDNQFIKLQQEEHEKENEFKKL